MKRSEGGLTIVEVMIVLSLATVIIFITFGAIPALQRNGRNARRARDVSLVAAYVSEYRTTHFGDVPQTCDNSDPDCWVHMVTLGYFDSDPSLTGRVAYQRKSAPSENPADNMDTGNDASLDRIMMYSYTRCAPDGTFTMDQASSKDVAIQYLRESHGDLLLTCVES